MFERMKAFNIKKGKNLERRVGHGEGRGSHSLFSFFLLQFEGVCMVIVLKPSVDEVGDHR